MKISLLRRWHLRVMSMTKSDVHSLFHKIDALRVAISEIEIPVAKDEEYKHELAPLLRAKRLLAQAAETLLTANAWLGYHELENFPAGAEVAEDDRA